MTTTLDRVSTSPQPRRPARRNFASLPEVLPLPNLIQTQLDSFKWFCDEGLQELFAEISPIQDFTGKNLDLRFLTSEFREPKYSEEECRTRDLTYAKPLWAKVELVNKETGEVNKRLRPGDPPTIDNARNLVNSLFFNFRRYDLAKVGRYKLNRKLGLDLDMTHRSLTTKYMRCNAHGEPPLEDHDDLARIVGRIIELNTGKGKADDIDPLGTRRVRAVGELIQGQFRIGLLRMERVVRERMSIVEPEKATPKELINIRPVVASIKEFFGGSQLSQFMQQTNPLDELTHKRRLSALGPGGLSRERAGFDVRDVHYSHYGRICPIETPEGPN